MDLPPISVSKDDPKEGMDAAKKINYAKYRDADAIPWQDVYAEVQQESILESAIELVKQFAPSENLDTNYLTLLVAYGLTPSVLSHVLPVLHLWGASGSGKSTFAAMLDRLHGGGGVLNGGTATYASVRNLIQLKRFKGGNTEVDNCLLVLDDVKAEKFLRDDNLYSFLRSGYDRATDKVTRAGVDAGTVMEFHTFCNKISTSVEMLANHAELQELKRRMMVIPFNRGASTNLLELAEYNWLDCNLVRDIWTDEQNIVKFINMRRSIKRGLRDLNPSEKIISVDIGATICTLTDMTAKEVCIFIGGIWDKQRQLLSNNSSPLKMLLTNHLALLTEVKIAEVPANDVKQLISQNGLAKNDGEVAETMADLGWKLGLGKSGKISWIYTGES